MGFHEKDWLSNCQTQIKPLFYARYVDDIFCLFKNEQDSELFLDYINKQHKNIRFTIEKEIEGILPFLDTTINRKQGSKPTISIFRKLTFTGLMLNYLSYNPLSYKLAVVKTLINRIYFICNSWKNFHNDLQKLRSILNRNMFPNQIIDNEVRRFLDKQYVKENKTKDSETEKKTSFFKLPYFEDISEKTRKKIKNIAKELCKETNIHINFSTFKIGTLFSVKDCLKSSLRSFVVYRFTCPGCNARYIGETTRHLIIRIEEHFTSNSSHIIKTY